MKNDLKQKPADPCKWLDDAPERAARWVNLYFSKCGKVGTGSGFYTSKKEAFDNAEESIIDAKERDIPDVQKVIFQHSNGVNFPFRDFSHHMQIPVKGTP